METRKTRILATRDSPKVDELLEKEILGTKWLSDGSQNGNSTCNGYNDLVFAQKGEYLLAMREMVKQAVGFASTLVPYLPHSCR